MNVDAVGKDVNLCVGGVAGLEGSPLKRKRAEGDRTNQDLVRSCRSRSSKAIANKRIE